METFQKKATLSLLVGYGNFVIPIPLGEKNFSRVTTCALILPLSHGSLDFSRNSRFLDSGSICNYFASHFGNYSIVHLDFEAFC